MIMRTVVGNLIPLAERRLLPDAMIRLGIRRLCEQRLKHWRAATDLERRELREELEARLTRTAIAESTLEANEQHYELPPEFFGLVLGKHRKYSSGFWPPEVRNLSEAEAESLAESATHASLENGQSVLELGCGWGSFSLWMAERFPNSQIVGLSNSGLQREYILKQARRRKLSNLEIRTADINDFDPGAHFDRIVSIEMLEHVRNYPALLSRMFDWLRPEGRLFVHVFRHSVIPYSFESQDRADWMSEHFFTGGVMPSHDLLPAFRGDLELEEDWQWDGTHYARTAEAWLNNLDHNASQVLEIFNDAYGKSESARWLQRWRIFFMSCAELFGFAGGTEWGVSHYRFKKP